MSTIDALKQEIKISAPAQDLKSLVEKSSKELARALPEHMRPERVVRIALTCLSTNPELSKCTPASFMGSLFAMAQLGLEPVGGRCYLLPFNNNRKIGNEWKTIKEVQLIVGYKGYVELFYRHDSALSIDMQEVHSNDFFEYEFGTQQYLRHKPAMKEKGDVIGYYAIAKLKGGACIFRYMTKEECMEHGKLHSKTYNNKDGKFNDKSPWVTEPDAMCKKTVLLQLSKLLPLSIEIQKAISADETSRDYRDGVNDAMELPVTTNWNDEKPEDANLKPIGESTNAN